nr:unnamed protein product [Digitaria exilis]
MDELGSKKAQPRPREQELGHWWLTLISGLLLRSASYSSSPRGKAWKEWKPTVPSSRQPLAVLDPTHHDNYLPPSLGAFTPSNLLGFSSDQLQVQDWRISPPFFMMEKEESVSC